MKTPLAAKLAENKVFASLNESDLAQLAQLSISRNHDRDTWIVHHGEVWPYLLWVEDFQFIQEPVVQRAVILEFQRT